MESASHEIRFPPSLQIPLTGSPVATKVVIEVKHQSEMLVDPLRGTSKSSHTADLLVLTVQQPSTKSKVKKQNTDGTGSEGGGGLSIPEVDRELLNRALERASTKMKFSGADGKTLLLHSSAFEAQFEQMALLGLGNWASGTGGHSILHHLAQCDKTTLNDVQASATATESSSEFKITPFSAAKAGKTLGGMINTTRAARVALCLSAKFIGTDAFKVLIESALLHSMPDKRFKGQLASQGDLSGTDSQNGNSKCGTLKGLTVYFDGEEPLTHYQAVLETAKTTAVGMQLARELVNTPPNYCNPESLAQVARQTAEAVGLQCKILGRFECTQRSMGAYLSVNQGSMYEPQFIHLIYKPSSAGSSLKRIAVVGKGICMDTGGYNLKTDAGINTMKFDMAGAAAVIGAAHVIGSIKPQNVEVHFVVPAAENMISQTAYRPGDVVTASNGITVEVGNTDAEGRLTLADALVYCDKEIQADCVVDCATLTGAIMVGLGTGVAGIYGNDNGWLGNLLSSARLSGTAIWPMPLFNDYESLFESKTADLNNTASARYGGSITAALFLKNFVKPSTPWCHIDLAGPVWDTSSKEATGYGVQMLVEAIRQEATRSNA